MYRVKTVLSNITSALGLERALAGLVARYGTETGDLPLRCGHEDGCRLTVLEDLDTGEIEIEVAADPESLDTDVE